MKDEIRVFQSLRGWAMIFVFISHCSYLCYIEGVNRLKYFGAAGVSLFIIVSGFLAARKYIGFNERENVISGVSLYCKRWKRFYKLHFITLLFALPVSFILLKTNCFKWFISFLANVTLVHALFPWRFVYFSFNAVTWFLSIVLVFSLLMPLALKIWEYIDDSKVLWFILCLNIIEFVLCYCFHDKPYAHWLLYVNPLIRFMDFLIGGYLYKLSKLFFPFNDNRLIKINKFFCSITFILFIFLLTVSSVLLTSINDNEYFATAIWTIPTSMLILTLHIGEKSNDLPSLVVTLFNNSIMKSFGNISFEFFMVHLLAIKYFSYVVKYMCSSSFSLFLYIIGYVLAFIFSVYIALLYRRINANLLLK